MDGDGQRDQAWVAQADDGITTFGITTAAGGVATVEFNSASPVQERPWW